MTMHRKCILLNRAWKTCFNLTFRNEEINKIKAILINNEYPKSLIERGIDFFLKDKMKKINFFLPKLLLKRRGLIFIT